MPAVPGYPAGTGLCVTRTAYDPAGQPTSTTLPTAGGAQPAATARRVDLTWTDDHLQAAVTSPSPTGTGTAVRRTRYDAAGRPLAVTDALGKTSTTSWTPDGLLAIATRPGYTRPSTTDSSKTVTISHVAITGYDADGQPVLDTDPLGQISDRAWTADGLLAAPPPRTPAAPRPARS